MTDSYPRRSARTRRFTLGVPRDITIAPDGSRVVFLRTRTGSDPVTCLWELDVATGDERLVVDPRTIASGSDQHLAEGHLPAEERARRERAREQADGIVAYAPDDGLTSVAFALSGALWVTGLASGTARRLETPPGINDPRLSPDGRHVAYVAAGALHVQELASGADRTLAEPDGKDVTWGLPEFIAAEELDRMRGYWWSPDGRTILVQRTDEAARATLAHRRSGRPCRRAAGAGISRRRHPERHAWTSGSWAWTAPASRSTSTTSTSRR